MTQAPPEPTDPQCEYWRVVQKHYRWNVTAHIVQGAVALFAMGLFVPETVLAAYLTTLTQSKFLIGLPWALALFYWYCPAILYSYHLQRRRQRRGTVIWLSGILRIGFVLFAVSAYAAAKWGPTPAIVIFLIAEAVLVITASGASMAWQDFTGRVLPPSRRGLIVGLREAIGDLAAFVASCLLFAFLAHKSPSAENYFWPFAAGAFVYILSIIPFAMMREPAWPVEPAPRGSWREYYGETFSILRADDNFRTYIVVRCLMSLTCIFNLGLFASYAITEFDVSQALVSGLFNAVSLVGMVIAAALAGWVADKHGFKTPLLGGIAATALMLAAGLSLKWAGDFAILGFFLVYFLAGAQNASIWVANFNLMLEFGRVEDRPRYISLTALFSAPISLAAALTSGLLADLLGYRAVMLIALVVSVGVWITVYLIFEEPRHQRAAAG